MILVTGHDVIVNQIAPIVVGALERQGATARWVRTAQTSDVEGADKVVLVPASLDRTHDARVIASVAANGSALVVLADTWQALRRVPADLASRASALVYPFPMEAGGVRDAGYSCPSFSIVPPHWGPMYRTMVSTQVHDASFIFVNGVKDGRLTQGVLESTCRVAEKEGIAVGFRPHPSEENVDQTRRQVILTKGRWVDCGGWSSAEAAAKARVSVFIGGSTDSIIACYARLPGVYYTDAESMARNRRMGMPLGKWIVEFGGLLSAGPIELESAIALMLTDDGRSVRRTLQESHFPLPPSWDTADAIAEVILAA